MGMKPFQIVMGKFKTNELWYEYDNIHVMTMSIKLKAEMIGTVQLVTILNWAIDNILAMFQ